MPINILMPALSPTMEKGNLAKWLKKEGEAVKTGDVIAEIETDKATMEYEAVEDGVMAKIVVPEGTNDVPVNQLIAVLAQEGEDPKAAAAAARRRGQPDAESPLTSTLSRHSGRRRKPQQAAAFDSSVPPQRRPRRKRRTLPLPSGRGRGRGRPQANGHGSQPHLLLATRASPRQGSRHRHRPHHRLRAAWPRHRPRRGRGEGRQGLCAHRPRAPSPAAAGAPAIAPSMSDQQIRALYEDGSYELIPHDGMRRTIAQRLTASVQTIPHFYLTIDCDIGKLLAAREEINAQAPKDKDGKPAYKLSVNDFVIKALALALQRVPDANVSWTEAGMLKHKHSDVGVAVALPGGLITPIIRNAETKSLSAISNEMKELAARARAKKLKPQEYQGGTTVGVQSRHVRHQGFHRRDQSAAIDHPCRRHRRGTRGREERQDRSRAAS